MESAASIGRRTEHFTNQFGSLPDSESEPD
jgi:hypothetical protein